MNAIRNKECSENPDTCWLCGNCRKHHETKKGAEMCCTPKGYDEYCPCRYCQNKLKQKGRKPNPYINMKDLTKKENWTLELRYINKSRLIIGFILGFLLGLYIQDYFF